MTPNPSPPPAPHVDGQGVDKETGTVSDVALASSPLYAFAYHEASDATLLLHSRDTSPDELKAHADHLGHTGGFPAAPSFIESRLTGLEEPFTPAVALALKRLPLVGGFVICPPDFARIGQRAPGLPLLWNGHCDAWISEMDEEDWVIREEIQNACDFEPEIRLEVVQKRLIDLAPYSLAWVKKVLPYKQGLVGRINGRCEKWRDMHFELEGREIRKDDAAASPPGSADVKPSPINGFIHPATRRAIEHLPECSAISRARVEEMVTSPTREEDVRSEQRRLKQLSDAGEIDRLEHFSALSYLMVAKTAQSASGLGEILRDTP